MRIVQRRGAEPRLDPIEPEPPAETPAEPVVDVDWEPRPQLARGDGA